jgi:osmotically-inducible protein OsmY
MKTANGFAAALTALVVATACTDTPRTDTTAESQAQPDNRANDGLIVTTIQAKYYGSPAVKGRDVNVDSEGGVVTLRGKVDTETAKREAVAIARSTTGVVKVEDQLTIASDADRTIARTGQPAASSPGWITTKIQAQFYQNPALKPWNIDVDTKAGGIVTLSGVVDNAADHAEAVKIVRGTDGVTTVNDRLRVKGEPAPSGTTDRTAADLSDGWITSKIQARYFADDDVKGRNIDVDTRDGVVTLRGTVHSYTERLQASAIARNTDGVREVHDELIIQPRSSEPERTAREAAGSVKDSVGTAGRAVEDSWITLKIQSRFFVDDQIKGRNVNVNTKNGVVTLKGTVTTEAAKKAAEMLASDTDGVTRVVNQLSIDPKSA